jgi:hypothetical protein
MVAIPTYLLASSAIASLGSLNPRNPVPVPTPAPVVSTPSQKEFATLAGPVIDTNFPDPAIITVDGESYAFATWNRVMGPGRINVQVAQSYNNQTWTLLEGYDAMPGHGAWETGNRVWAPDVIQLVGIALQFYRKFVLTMMIHRTTGRSFFTMPVKWQQPPLTTALVSLRPTLWLVLTSPGILLLPARILSC